jgi:septal ring factor EnvC (AmiA/AmiB activator)
MFETAIFRSSFLAVFKRFLTCLVVICCFGGLPVAAQEDGKASSDVKLSREEIIAALDSTKRRANKEEERLRQLQKREKEIRNQLKRIKKEQASITKESSELRTTVERIDLALEKLDKAVAQGEKDMVSLRKGINDRLVAIYKTRRRTLNLDFLFEANSTADLLKRSYYLSLIAEHDAEYFKRLVDTVKTFSLNKGKLARAREEREIRADELSALAKKLESQSVAKAALLRESREKSKSRKKSLVKLRKSVTEMEEVLSSLMGGAEITAPPSAVEIASAVKTEPVAPDPKGSSVSPPPSAAPSPTPLAIAKASKSTIPSLPFKGRGLRALKGKLSFPVTGTLLQTFGKQRHQEFSDILFKKGLEVRAKEGASVKAVATGKVIFDSELPGYGKVVILDHGARYYTLYGRLRDSKVKVGQTKQAGETIAVLGSADTKGRNFYFELRIRGKATNPGGYFRRLPPKGKVS